jgi:hypothetical protein
MPPVRGPSVFAVFRATGRFFWPLAYLGLVWTLATLGQRLPSRVLIAVLFTGVTVQALDLHGAHEERAAARAIPAFYEWHSPMVSPLWSRVLPQYDHLVLYPPPQCGPSPIPYEPAAYQAGLHGLTINAGGVARPDEAAQLRYCHELGDQMKAGPSTARSFYIVPARGGGGPARGGHAGRLVCGPVDGVSACVSAASYDTLARPGGAAVTWRPLRLSLVVPRSRKGHRWPGCAPSRRRAATGLAVRDHRRGRWLDGRDVATP